MLVVRDVKFLGGFLHNFRDFPVVHMADIGEQMVLDLVVQPSDKPGKKHTFVGEIGRRFHLVNGEMVFHATTCIGYKKVRFFNHMRWLENEGQNQSAYVLHHQKAQYYLPPGQVDKNKRQHQR